MYQFINTFIIIHCSYQTLLNNNTLYSDNVLSVFCADKKQKEMLNCQPNFNTNVNTNIESSLMPRNIYPAAISPSRDYNIGFTNPNIILSPMEQSPGYSLLQSSPVITPSSSTVSPPPSPSVNANTLIGSGQKIKTTPHTQITLNAIPLSKNKPVQSNRMLSSVLNENPIAKTQLINFLEYNGVPPPWDQLLDFETTQHHRLPNPENLFKKIRKQLLTFDNVKTCIVEALVNIEKYINRGKSYLAEDLKDLCRDKTLLKNILTRLYTKPAYEFRSELFKRYSDIKSKSAATQKSFYELRDWLLQIKKLFATL